jgi:hypothetical protein
MAKTIINLSDPISTLVTKTNTISSHLGDLAQLNVGGANDSDLVQAINYVNAIVQKTDSADIINLIDSDYVIARQTTASSAAIKANFQKDSANGIGFDSSEGRFFVPSNTINTAMIEDNAITGGKIENNAIIASKINTNAVITAKILDNNVTTAKILDGNVTTAKIADNNVTEAKMANDAVGSAELKTLSTLLIKDVSGNTLKTIHGAGA